MTYLKEIRLHGRGGQGAVLGAEILVIAAVSEGKHSQMIPAFGFERRGAPVESYVKMDNNPITLRTLVHEPDCVAVLDPTLQKAVKVTDGLKEKGIILLNDKRNPEDIDIGLTGVKIATVDATNIALKTLGLPITNTAILGALSAATNWVKLESVLNAIKKRFPEKLITKNVEATKLAFEQTRIKDIIK